MGGSAVYAYNNKLADTLCFTQLLLSSQISKLKSWQTVERETTRDASLMAAGINEAPALGRVGASTSYLTGTKKGSLSFSLKSCFPLHTTLNLLLDTTVVYIKKIRAISVMISPNQSQSWSDIFCRVTKAIWKHSPASFLNTTYTGRRLGSRSCILTTNKDTVTMVWACLYMVTVDHLSHKSVFHIQQRVSLYFTFQACIVIYSRGISTSLMVENKTKFSFAIFLTNTRNFLVLITSL